MSNTVTNDPAPGVAEWKRGAGTACDLPLRVCSRPQQQREQTVRRVSRPVTKFFPPAGAAGTLRPHFFVQMEDLVLHVDRPDMLTLQEAFGRGHASVENIPAVNIPECLERGGE